jgi:hypothetical protein
MEYGKEVHDEAIVATLIPKFKALKVFKGSLFGKQGIEICS